MSLKEIFSSILSAFLPPRCIKCGKVLVDRDGLCDECFKETTFIFPPFCKKCGRPFYEEPADSRNLLCGFCVSGKKKIFRLARACMEYDDSSSPMILSFKFFDRTEYKKVFAEWLRLSGTDIFEAGVDVIMPIPLHYTRLIKRRYNQSALLAKELSKLTGIPCDMTAAVRHRRTKPQIKFSGRARVENVKDAFSVKHPDKIKGKRIVLIDDVQTTGSTLNECAKALLKAGAASVDYLTLSRVDL